MPIDNAHATETANSSQSRILVNLGTWLKTCRVHQWLKNLLIFMPMVAAHRFDTDSVLAVGIAFLSFSLCAASLYILNDIHDRFDDVRHPYKRFRPIASGELSPLYGLAGAAVLLLISVLLAAIWLPPYFMGILSIYYFLGIGYTLFLKRIRLLDVFVLASLFILRIYAGGAALHLEISFWMLLLAMFLFLSLATMKRHSELLELGLRGESMASGRGYLADDHVLMMTLGLSSGLMSVMVLALYINSPSITEAYTRPGFLLAICPLLLFWLSYVWWRSHLGRMYYDPIVFAAKDPVSLLVGAAAGVLFMLSL